MSSIARVDRSVTARAADFLSGDVASALLYYGGVLPFRLYTTAGLCIAVAMLPGNGRKRAMRAYILPALLAFALTQGLKHAIRRERPRCASRRRGAGQRCGAATRWQSFPSGHAGAAFALATGLMFELDGARKRAAVAAVALLVGASRVAGGYHYVGDVVAGAAIGSACGALAQALADDD